MVGNLSGGLTAVAFQVTDPSLTSRFNTGMAPPFSDSLATPSTTKRMTCSGCTCACFAGALDGDVAASLSSGIATNTDPIAKQDTAYTS